MDSPLFLQWLSPIFGSTGSVQLGGHGDLKCSNAAHHATEYKGYSMSSMLAILFLCFALLLYSG